MPRLWPFPEQRSAREPGTVGLRSGHGARRCPPVVRMTRGGGTVGPMTDVTQGSQLGRDEQRLRAAELDTLLRRSALGDVTAFGTLYDRTAVKLFRLALVVLGDQRRAEDTTRSAYAQIWARSREFDGAQHRALSWMATIVYDLARAARAA
jgi:hypothetical protein